MTPTPLTRDDIIARNLATIADHFANENPDGIARRQLVCPPPPCPRQTTCPTRT
jgi:hypothetical protein